MHRMLYNHLIADVDVNVFTEGVAFRQTSGAVLHQVKGFQRAERSQQLLHLRHYARVTVITEDFKSPPSISANSYKTLQSVLIIVNLEMKVQKDLSTYLVTVHCCHGVAVVTHQPGRR